MNAGLIRVNNYSTNSGLNAWLVDWLIGWLVDWLIDWSIDLWIDWLHCIVFVTYNISKDDQESITVHQNVVHDW